MRVGITRGFVLLAVLLALAGAAHGQDNWQTAQLPYWAFGHVWNTANGNGGGAPMPWCASTATINAFQYLENTYPGVYKNRLIGDDIVQSRDSLKDMMAAFPNGGASDQTMWEGKVNFVNTRAPQTTRFSGMVSPGIGFGNWQYSQLLTGGWPSFQWLFQRLQMNAGVELCIVTNQGGHALTLTSLKYNDRNFNSIWDWDSESARIDYLDPNNPIKLFEASLWRNPSGSLGFVWSNDGKNPAQGVYIALAYSESLVPEPSGLLALACGLGTLLRIRRKMRT